MNWNLLEIRKEAMYLFVMGFKDLVLCQSAKESLYNR
jgi:hypothetical protein